MKSVSMRSFILWIILVVGLLAGCSSPDAAVVGDWKADKGDNTMAFKADHTVSAGTGQTAMAGTWALKDKTVTIKLVTLGGKPVAEQKADMDKQVAMIPPAAMTGALKKKIDAAKQLLDSGVVTTLSNDGKTMSLTLMDITQTLTKVDAKS